MLAWRLFVAPPLCFGFLVRFGCLLLATPVSQHSGPQSTTAGAATFPLNLPCHSLRLRDEP